MSGSYYANNREAFIIFNDYFWCSNAFILWIQKSHFMPLKAIIVLNEIPMLIEINNPNMLCTFSRHHPLLKSMWKKISVIVFANFLFITQIFFHATLNFLKISLTVCSYNLLCRSLLICNIAEFRILSVKVLRKCWYKIQLF